MKIYEGDALTLIQNFPMNIDLVVTDPPYAFGGSGGEHALSATVAVVLRECAQSLKDGAWMLVFSASSWRSMSYMVESVRGVLEPVRVATWTKPASRTKVACAGWRWASVSIIAFRNGKSRELPEAKALDHFSAPPLLNGRRAQLPREVADWAVKPFAVSGGIFLDPFAGSGALPEAAERCGMQAYGFEKKILGIACIGAER